MGASAMTGGAFVQRCTSTVGGPVFTAVTGVDLPVGGISVVSSGAIYAAVWVSRSALADNGTAIAEMLRIDPAGGRRQIVASGHFLMPVARGFPLVSALNAQHPAGRWV